MMKVAYKKLLGEITNISSGYPLRTSVSGLNSGDVSMIQLGDVNYDFGILWQHVHKVALPSESHKIRWLKEGDILFAARNSNNFAFALKSVPLNTVCVPHFFVLTVKDTSVIEPDFLAWQINQIPAQTYLKKSSGVSLVPNINRRLLENIVITMPSIEKQTSLMNMHRTFLKEKQILQKLIYNREQQINAIANDIII